MIDRLSDPETGAVVDEFEFEHDGRRFTCSAASAHPARAERWWWFRVSPDPQGQRYAPFPTGAADTRASVQARVLAYHDALLEARARPLTRGPWGRRPAAGATVPAQAGVSVADPVA